MTGYVDAALPPAEHAAIEAHLETCEACREQVAFETSLRRRLKAMPHPEPRPGFEAELRSRLGPTRRRPVQWAAAAATVALTVVGGRATAPFVAWELSRDHTQCTVVDRPSSEAGGPAGLASWFGTRGTPMPTPPAAAGGLALTGAGHCQLWDRTRVAHLHYAEGARHVSLFVVPRTILATGLAPQNVGGNAVRFAKLDSRTVGLVSDSADDVEAFERGLVLADRAAVAALLRRLETTLN